MKKLLSLLLALMCAMSLIGCDDDSDTTEIETQVEAQTDADLYHIAGEYTFIGLLEDGRFFHLDEAEGWSVTLDEDGKGYLYFGDDSHGSMDSWSYDGETLSINTKGNVLYGSIDDGIMLLTIDETVIGFAVEGANLQELDYDMTEPDAITDEDSEDSISGIYYPFAKFRDEMYVAMPENQLIGSYTINSDGTASCVTKDGANEYYWKYDGIYIYFYDVQSGELARTGSIGNGVMFVEVVYTSSDGSSITALDLLAREDADTSCFTLVSIDEYNAIMLEIANQ